MHENVFDFRCYVVKVPNTSQEIFSPIHNVPYLPEYKSQFQHYILGEKLGVRFIRVRINTRYPRSCKLVAGTSNLHFRGHVFVEV